jgi:hypothetical protein
MDDRIGEHRVESNDTAEDIVEDNSSADRNVENSGGEIPLNQPVEKPKESESSEQKLLEDTPVESEEDMATDMTEKPTMKTRGGFTMYERSMMQKEERERKLKALQQTLEADFTFAPNSANKPRPRSSSAESLVSSLGDSPSVGLISSGGMSVFSRLYSAETAASRAQQHVAVPTNNDRSAFGSTAVSMAGRSVHLAAATTPASPRLESLFKAGEEKLRARHLSDQEEAEQIKRRLENEALKLPGVYTFRPQTKWDLVAQRRKLALEAKEQEADETRRTTPNALKEVSF